MLAQRERRLLILRKESLGNTKSGKREEIQTNKKRNAETEKRNPNGASSASGWAVAAYSLKIEKF